MSPFADLAGQSALVTGAGSAGGIGFACARLLGRMGARVAISSTTERIHDRVAELVALGIDAFGVAADLTESKEATALVAAVAERRGRMDILVNNAGMTSVSRPEQPAPLQGLSDAAFAEALQRNLATAFYVTRAALARMIPAGYGRIVNVSSVSGPIVAYRGDAGYHADLLSGAAGRSRHHRRERCDRLRTLGWSVKHD